jgi:hypothetical protein
LGLVNIDVKGFGSKRANFFGMGGKGMKSSELKGGREGYLVAGVSAILGKVDGPDMVLIRYMDGAVCLKAWLSILGLPND